MNIVSRGTAVASRKNTPGQSNAFASVCVLPGGRWMCGFRAAPSKQKSAGQKACITWSDDEGKSWCGPVEPFTAPSLGRKPGVFRAVCLTALGGEKVLAVMCWVDYSDPSLPLFNEKTQGVLDLEIFFSVSEDRGAHWSKPWQMDTAPFDQPTPLTGPVLLLKNGEWACQFELNNSYHDASVWRHSSVLMFSRDAGKTWPEHAIASNDPENRIFYWDQRPGLLRDGRVLDLFWTYDNKEAVYLNIHAGESLDNGRTWSGLWDTGVPGQPAPPVSLRDGRIAMVYVDRTGPPAVKVRVSSDSGRTWPDETETLIYKAEIKSQTWQKGRMQDAWAEMGKFSVGLPATAALQNGDVLAVYYAGESTDQTDIRWARLRP